MKYYLNKVQTLIPLLGKPRYKLFGKTKRYEFTTPFYIYQFMFDTKQNIYCVRIFNRMGYTHEFGDIMFKDFGKINDEQAIDYTFESLAQIMVTCELI